MFMQIYFWFMVVIMCLNLGLSMEKHNKLKTGKHHVMEGVIGILFWLPALVFIFNRIYG